MVEERNKPMLSINRVPTKTLQKFLDYSKEEFCDDRGMALKDLVDYRFNNDIPMLLEMIANMELRIKQIEETKSEKKEKTYVKMLDGKLRGGMNGK